MYLEIVAVPDSNRKYKEYVDMVSMFQGLEVYVKVFLPGESAP